MRLRSISYSQFEGAPEEWTLSGLTLQNLTLLVGKNASGKSRILNVIHRLALAIANKRSLSNSHFILVFDENGKESNYELDIRESKIALETFAVDGELKLERGTGGKGKIFAEKEYKHIEFQTPENQLAVVARRDTIQHPFFEPLHQWASSLYHYAFNTPMGKEPLAFFGFFAHFSGCCLI